MDISKKDQNQTAGDNAVQTQIETQNNYSVTNHIYNIIQSTEDVIANATEDRREELTIEGCNTSLWKRTLGKDDKNVEPLRESFLDARKKTEFILGKIRKDFPNLTMHETTHVDSLWKVADVIIGDNDINPLEGYVLGIAFLIHDIALSHEAFGGVEKLRDTAQWKDAYADGSDEQNEEEFKKECDYIAIRAIHLKKAEGILEEPFQLDDGTEFYIIENNTYRTNFGKLIGEIAASHHCKNIDEVESKFKNKRQINPLSWMPREWKINAQKLACLLRCADVGHIEDGRAPDSIYHFLDVNGVSQQQWESQNYLCQVCEDEDDTTKLCITSSHPFLKKDFDAWNVAFDAVRLFDEELKKSNDLLKRNTPKNSKDLSFPHKGISGAESKEALAKYIQTDGWQPCSFGVHTSNVKALIENLGGSKLYGEENQLLVALRELIQNARDAIHARRMLENDFDEGRITIRLKEDGGKRWIEVEDNGIGMSLDCIKYNLLDFGSSYWKSNLAKDENPGLRSKRFKSIGKFGIGFYSVFMVAKSVVVVTRRYNESEDSNIVEFPEGLTLSPILSPDTLSTRVSTLVRFELKEDINTIISIPDSLIYQPAIIFDKPDHLIDKPDHLIDKPDHLIDKPDHLNDKLFDKIMVEKRHKTMVKEFYETQDITLSKALSIVTAGLDTDIYYEDDDVCHRIHQNTESPCFNKEEWLAGLFLVCPVNISELASNLEKLTNENGNVIGWVIPPEWILKIVFPKNISNKYPCIKTIGGLSASLRIEDNYLDKGYLGYLNGIETSVSRNEMVLDGTSKKCFHSWAIKKYRDNYYKIVDSKKLSEAYVNLIMYECGLYRKMISENERLIYSMFLEKIEIGSMYGLFIIHRYLLRGIVDYYAFSDIKKLETLCNNNWEKEKILKFNSEYYSDKIRVIENIDKMGWSNYSEIIYKFYYLRNKGEGLYFPDKPSLIWVNLMLHKRLHQMIDWRKVDLNILEVLSQEKYSSKLGNYLEQYLSSTYIYEITAPQKDE